MTKHPKSTEAQRKRAYEHIARSLETASDVLIECCQFIDDAELDAPRNTFDINLILGWTYDVNSRIYEMHPDLAPPESEPPLRRWPKDPSKPAADQKLTRKEALYRLRRQLDLARLILQEASPFAIELGLSTDDLDEQLAEVKKVHTSVLEEIWQGLSDEKRRQWVRDWGLPDGFVEPPPRERLLERLNDKLDTAGRILDDCAGLIVNLELEPKEHLSAVGSCLGTVFTIQQQIYEERPDLMPEFLKESYEVRRQEDERIAKMKEEDQ